MFKNSIEYNEILKELTLNETVNSIADFSCFADGIATYIYSENNTFQEFNIICSDSYQRNMSVADLLNLKGVTYFQHSIYLAGEKVASKTYNFNNDFGLN